MDKPASTSLIRVLLPIFPGFNTLDLNGPLEILGNAALVPPNFSITIAAATRSVTAFENVSVVANVDFVAAKDLVQNGEFDVLIMPGGGPGTVQAVIKSGGDGLLDLLSAFVNLDSTGKDRWLISICTGALLVGSVGGFVGMRATTHWAALTGTNGLDEICQSYINSHGGNPTQVIRKRWVDGGENENGVRILSSGGISCGLDCILWFISQRLGLQSAVNIATMMDYVWNFPHDVLVPGYGPPATAWTTVQGF